MTQDFPHLLPPRMTERAVRVAVVGCGGTGSAFLAGLPHLHNSMIALGHPAGLSVAAFDGDQVSPSNSVRQPFGQHDIGQDKATLLVTRLNLFWGLTWNAVPVHVNRFEDITSGFGYGQEPDIVVSCVDTRSARATLKAMTVMRRTPYVLDFGNDSTFGQVILGSPSRHFHARDGKNELPCSWDLHPELADASLDQNDPPSCSALESITRQAPFVNQTVATYGLAMLARLFRDGGLATHGGYLNVAAGTATPITVSASTWIGINPRLAPPPPRKRPTKARTPGSAVHTEHSSPTQTSVPAEQPMAA